MLMEPFKVPAITPQKGFGLLSGVCSTNGSIVSSIHFEGLPLTFEEDGHFLPRC